MALKTVLDRVMRQRTALAAFVAMSIKGVGALLTLAIFTLAARAMSADAFGELAVWFNAMSFLAVAAVFGQDTLIARHWGEYNGRGEADHARGAYRFGWRTTIVSGVIFVIGVLVVAPFLNVAATPATLLAGVAYLFAQTLLHYSSHSSRVVIGFLVSETGREIIWRVTLLAVVVQATFGNGLTPAQFFVAGAAGMALSLLFQSRAIWRKLSREPIRAVRQDDRGEWLKRGRDMWLSAIVEAASQYADVILIGYFASPAIAGDYFVAARIANIFLMVQTGLNTYSFTHSANLYFSGQKQKLQDILRALVSVAAALVAPVLLLIYVFGEQILMIFGQRYASVYPTLVVLATACFIMSLSGSASVILLTTGHEKLYSRVITAATLARMTLTAILAMTYGAFGAACGWAIVNAPLFIGLALICRRVCGVDPSIVSLFTRARAAGAARLDAQAKTVDS